MVCLMKYSHTKVCDVIWNEGRAFRFQNEIAYGMIFESRLSLDGSFLRDEHFNVQKILEFLSYVKLLNTQSVRDISDMLENYANIYKTLWRSSMIHFMCQIRCSSLSTSTVKAVSPLKNNNLHYDERIHLIPKFLFCLVRGLSMLYCFYDILLHPEKRP